MTDFKPHIVGRIITATITLVCVLIIYNGWANLEVRDVVVVIVGPVLAIVISHAFASGLVQHIELERRLTGREWLSTVVVESRMLLLAVPPLAIFIAVSAAGASVSEGIRIVVWLESISLGFWAGFAAHRAGLRRGSLALAVTAGLVVGLVVLALQVILEPGKTA